MNQTCIALSIEWKFIDPGLRNKKMLFGPTALPPKRPAPQESRREEVPPPASSAPDIMYAWSNATILLLAMAAASAAINRR